jgi:hypothetical protein
VCLEWSLSGLAGCLLRMILVAAQTPPQLPDFDQLAFTGQPTLDGALIVTLMNGFSPNPV